MILVSYPNLKLPSYLSTLSDQSNQIEKSIYLFFLKFRIKVLRAAPLLDRNLISTKIIKTKSP